MNNLKVIERIHDLETEIEEIKLQLGEKSKQSKNALLFQRLAKFLLSNWILLSFLAGAATAIYVKYRFDIDYFEQYRAVSATKKLSDFYRTLGDRLMMKSEWGAAEAAYKSAVGIDPHNTAATYGMVKAQVFQPVDGEKYVAGEVVDAKLRYLQSQFKDDGVVDYLQAMRYEGQLDEAKAQESLRTAIKKDPTLVAAYINLALLEQESGLLEEARQHLDKARELDPGDPVANDNAGFLALLQLRFPEAVKLFDASYYVSGKLSAIIDLGIAHRYSNNFSEAVFRHKEAVRKLDQTDERDQRFLDGDWIYNYMPLKRNDTKTPTQTLTVSNLEQKKAFAHYELSFDYALQGDFRAANSEFETAHKVYHSPAFESYFRSEIATEENLLPVGNETRRWFDQRKSQLD